ncbi:MAG: threonine ammonia-lyase, partial [Methanobacteriota archaeon]
MLDLRDIEAARGRIRGAIHHTPLVQSASFSSMTGSDLYLKLENLQRTGSFKVRGAYNKILTLKPEERGKGVIAASAGNHAQGVALAAREAGIPATIVMPADAPIPKVEATRNYGAEVVLFGRDYQEAYEHARSLQGKSGATFIHAFDDDDVIAGQGTLGLEILEDLPDADVVLVGVGGGGLVAGIATAVKARRSGAEVVAVEAKGAGSLGRSFPQGRIVPIETVDTIADGLGARAIGERPFALIRKFVDRVVTVDDSEIATAILHLLERAKTVAEGAGAAALAACLSGKVDIAGKKAVALVSGGNIDI